MIKKRISIYTDEGASHSFIWLITLFETRRIYSVDFVTSEDIRNDCLANSDILIISGGDSFAIAESLGANGAKSINSFILRGGVYAGICAGAYLMLRSSKEPLHHFNLTSGKINNLSSSLPEARSMEYKYSIAYGCSYIYHPVRGEIIIETIPQDANEKKILIHSPIYGGPFIKNDNAITPLALFQGFTDNTMFLVDREFAEKTCSNSILAGGKKSGSGTIFFFSTHMEHPDYPLANDYFLRYLTENTFIENSDNKEYGNNWKKYKNRKIENKKYFTFRKNIREMRLLSIGIENRQGYWQIGKKIWETEKVRAFTESLFEMDMKYGNFVYKGLSEEDISILKSLSFETLDLLRKINGLLKDGKPSQSFAEDYFKKVRTLLSRYTSICFSYAESKSQ